MGDAQLFDVAPTVLASLGLPVGDHVDGDVLPPAEATERRAYPEREPAGPAASAGDAVEDRLSQLGYLD